MMTTTGNTLAPVKATAITFAISAVIKIDKKPCTPVQAGNRRVFSLPIELWIKMLWVPSS